MTPEEAIQQSLQSVQGMQEQFDPPPPAAMPQGESAPQSYQDAASSSPMATGGNADQLLQQMLNVMQAQTEMLGHIATGIQKMSEKPPEQQAANSADRPGPIPPPQKSLPVEKQQRAAGDFQKLTGLDINRVADPMEAFKQIVRDRQSLAKDELDEQLKNGSLTESKHKEKLQSSNRRIYKQAKKDMDAGEMNGDIANQQKDAINTQIDWASAKYGTSGDDVRRMKKDLGTERPPLQQNTTQSDPPKQTPAGGNQKQANDQIVAMLNKLLQEKKQADDDINNMSQQLAKLNEDLNTLTQQSDANRQRNQRAGVGK